MHFAPKKSCKANQKISDCSSWWAAALLQNSELLKEYVALLVALSSGGSVYNLYAEEEDRESSAAAQQSLENSITMTKMKLLKAKMESMNINKKVSRMRNSIQVCYVQIITPQSMIQHWNKLKFR